MPNSSMKSSLQSLAASFADAVLDAIKGASLQELLAESGGARRGPGRPPRSNASPPSAPRAARGGRLKRRSAEDIAAALEQVVALVKKHKAGYRAEQIRKTLKMQAKEMPRVLSEGLATHKLKKRGQKRATTYTAA
jgi:hypothetical protein